MDVRYDNAVNTQLCLTCIKKCLLILSVEIIFILMDLPMAKLIKLAKMACVMHEADHAYTFWSTW